VAAQNKSVEDSLRASNGAPEPGHVAARPDMVVAERVIMVIEFKRRMFQLSRCSPTLWCISILSVTNSKIARNLVVVVVVLFLLLGVSRLRILSSYNVFGLTFSSNGFVSIEPLVWNEFLADIFGTNRGIGLNFDTVTCFLLKEKEERCIDEICKEAMELEFWITLKW